MVHTTTLKRMRKKASAVAVAALLLAPQAVGAAEVGAPRITATPPGQIKIVTINARQNAVLGIKRFEDMFELAKQLRKRPLAFNGGSNGAVAPPDVVATQEMRPSNFEIFEHIFEQRFKTKYRPAGPEDAASQMIYNPDRVTLQGDVVTWEDVCLGESSAGNRHGRFYQFARFTENATGAPFVVTAVHIPKRFESGTDCYQRNIAEMKNQLAGETTATFILGDFNRRSVETIRECDVNEISAPQAWWTELTEIEADGSAFVDAVRLFHRFRNLSMEDEWTQEQKSTTVVCNGNSVFRRSRIDYIFSRRAETVEAHADHPGWAGELPGTKMKGVHKYSDHRWVWGRFVISGPPQPARPNALQRQGGAIDLSWTPVEGATAYVVYRGIGKRDFSEVARVDPTITSYIDTSTRDSMTYRYVIAAIGAGGGQGAESLPMRVTVDSRGPKVSSVDPTPGASDIDRHQVIKVVFDEGVAPSSVTADRIRLYRGTKRLSGVLTQQSRRVLLFDPTFPLWRGVTHRAVVKPVRDPVGNLGGSYSWSFTTAPGTKGR